MYVLALQTPDPDLKIRLTLNRSALNQTTKNIQDMQVMIQGLQMGVEKIHQLLSQLSYRLRFVYFIFLRFCIYLFLVWFVG